MTKFSPLPSQRDDLKTLRDYGYVGLLACEPGSGKTYGATLVIMDAKPGVTLILAPKATHATAWIPTVRDNAGITPRIIGNQNKASKEALQDFLWGYPGVYLSTPQFATRSDVSDWRGDLLICDEIHAAGATPKSKLQRKLSGYHPSDGEPLAERFPMRLALSGTPFRQAFVNAWGTARFLAKDAGERDEAADRNLYRWQDHRQAYENVYTNQRDHFGRPKQVKQYLAEKTPGKWLSDMAEHVAVIQHKRRETCCVHHPGGFLKVDEPQVIERVVPLTAKQHKSIRELEATMMTYLVEDHPLEVTIPLTMRQRVRQLVLAEAESIELEDGRTTIEFPEKSASPFTDETFQILSEVPADEAVLIHLESQRYAEVLVAKLNEAGFTAAEYSGKRKADLSRFGKNYRVLVGVVSALGTGTDGLQKVCNTEIWFEQPVSLTLRDQAYARLERMHGRKVQRYVLLDDADVMSGMREDNILKQMMIQRSLRRA